MKLRHRQQLVEDDGTKAKVTGPCVFCQKQHTTESLLPLAGLNMWNGGNGPYIQKCLPFASGDDREFLLSGICPKCWNDTVGEEDNDDE